MRDTLRLIRLLRMLRLFRVMRLTERWDMEFGFSHTFQELVKLFFLTTCTAHWMACVWLLAEGRVLLDSGSGPWLPDDRESWLSALIRAKGDICMPDANDDLLCVYTIALYWSMMTLTTVGYGDIV